MKKTVALDDDMVVKKGVALLIKNLGPAGAGRFISMIREKRVDSVKRHRDWQSKLEPDSFLDEIFGKSRGA